MLFSRGGYHPHNFSQQRSFDADDSIVILDATAKGSTNGGRLTMDWRMDDDEPRRNNEIPLFERDTTGRRSDQQHLINGDRHGSFQNEQRLPQVYGEIVLTPSTPGIDENKALIRKGRLAEESDGPPDRFSAVYFIILINGIGTLMPWNMFITADAYFREVKLGGTELAENFQSYLGIAAQVPNLLFNLINLFVTVRGKLTFRILSSLMLMIIIFVMTAILAMVDSSNWPGLFFGITMTSVVLINCAVGVYQNCVYGVAADLPMQYSSAVVLGSNVSGTLVSLINILSMSFSTDKQISAIYYFVSALFVLLVCFDSYFVLPLCRFFRFHHDRAHHHRLAEAELQKKEMGGVSAFLHVYIHVIKEAWVQMFNIFFVFFVTLTIFPAMQVDVRPVDPNFWLPADDTTNSNYFRAVTCFLFFNFFAMVGSLISHWIQIPGPRFVLIPILLRGFMIPYFMFCNYRPDKRLLPVYIDNDYAYIFVGILMALSSGYFSSLVMMYAPRVVAKDKARVAAMMATFFLILGIVAGVNFSLVVALLVGHKDHDHVTPINFSTNSTFS